MIDLEEKKEILRESGMEETVKVPSNAIQVKVTSTSKNANFSRNS